MTCPGASWSGRRCFAWSGARSMRSVGAALPRALKSLGISRRTREAQALWLWPQVVGPHLARETGALMLLTFTEKAAREVLDRVELEDELPAGERFVLTYHAFAQRFLQEEGWLCGIPKSFRIISEVRKWELMRDVLLAQRPPYLFHAQRPYERIAELLKLVERLKQELVSPDEFVAWAGSMAAVDDP